MRLYRVLYLFISVTTKTFFKFYIFWILVTSSRTYYTCIHTAFNCWGYKLMFLMPSRSLLKFVDLLFFDYTVINLTTTKIWIKIHSLHGLIGLSNSLVFITLFPILSHKFSMKQNRIAAGVCYQLWHWIGTCLKVHVYLIINDFSDSTNWW